MVSVPLFLRALAGHLVSAFALILAFWCRAAWCDREPIPLPILVDRSEVIVWVTVEDVWSVSEVDELGAARVEVVGEPLKGEIPKGSSVVRFHLVRSSRSITPVQLGKGKRFLLFLRSEKGHYQLTDAYGGAILADKIDQKMKAGIQNIIAQDGELEVAFQAVKLTLGISSRKIVVGDAPILTFEVTNGGKNDISIVAEPVDSKGSLVMKGWTNLKCSSWRNQGRLVRSAELGGAQYRFARTTTIRAGQSKKWAAQFTWGDYGKKPGIYRICWRFGKATSNTVTYEVVESSEALLPSHSDSSGKPVPLAPVSQTVDTESGRARVPVEGDTETPAIDPAFSGQLPAAAAHQAEQAPPSSGGDNWPQLVIALGAVLALGAAGAWLLLRKRSGV